MFDYFKFNLYGDTRVEKVETGKFIFQNRNNMISGYNILPFLVFHFIVDYNLSDLELFFRLAGFSAFTQEEFEKPISDIEIINLPKRKNTLSEEFGGLYYEKEEVKQIIEEELGEGIISRYLDIKKKQLQHEKNKLLTPHSVTDKELEGDTLSKIDSQHYSK